MRITGQQKKQVFFEKRGRLGTGSSTCLKTAFIPPAGRVGRCAGVGREVVFSGALKMNGGRHGQTFPLGIHFFESEVVGMKKSLVFCLESRLPAGSAWGVKIAGGFIFPSSFIQIA